MVITINAVNFIDGLDGLAAGIVGIGAAAFFAYYFTLTHGWACRTRPGPRWRPPSWPDLPRFLPHNYHRRASSWAIPARC